MKDINRLHNYLMAEKKICQGLLQQYLSAPEPNKYTA